MHGIGTYENYKYIYKGHWRDDKKAGNFIKTNKHKNTTHIQLWVDNNKVENKLIQYIQPAALDTYKHSPLFKIYQKKYKNTEKNTEKKCVGCFINSMNATNISCGHISMCYGCLSKCDKCPICRVNITNIIKLYVS